MNEALASLFRAMRMSGQLLSSVHRCDSAVAVGTRVRDAEAEGCCL